MALFVWVQLLILAIIWSSSFFFVEIILIEISPLTVVLHRVLWAIPVLWLVVWFLKIPFPKGLRVWGVLAIMGLLNNVIPFSLIAWGQTHIESGLSSIFNAMTALFGILIAGMFLPQEHLTIAKLLGVVFGLIGVTFIIGYEALEGIDFRNFGQLAIIIATLSYAFAGVWGRKFMIKLAPQAAAAGMVTCSAIWLLPFALLIDGIPTFTLSLPVWGAIVGFSVLCTAGAYLLYFNVLKIAGAANLSLVTLLIPPGAIFLGWMFLGESLHSSAFIGFTFIAIGLVIIDGRLFRALATRFTGA